MIAEPLVAPALPAEPTTPMKLSEALRLGRILMPTEIAGSMYRFDRDNQIVGACAFGAILIGYGDPDDLGGFDRFMRTVEPGILHCPACDLTAQPTSVITHLNDRKHSWPSRAIATWLESIGL